MPCGVVVTGWDNERGSRVVDAKGRKKNQDGVAGLNVEQVQTGAREKKYAIKLAVFFVPSAASVGGTGGTTELAITPLARLTLCV